MPEPRLVEDGWLANHLGKPCFHLTGDLARIDGCAQVLDGKLGEASVFVDVKVDVNDATALRAVQSRGFQLIDTTVRLSTSRAACSGPAPPEIGFADPAMATAVAAVAERAFIYDRFHRDPAIPGERANAVKRNWALNFFAGRRGDWMVVACHDGHPVGFLQLLRSPADDLVIDLIAVDGAHRGEGLARDMIAFASANCPCEGRIVVGTQVANVPSVRLYESMGFRLESAQYVLHHHGGSHADR
jgi:ribosomal protein S18 acetylase RimI-like enzyme